MESEKVQTKKIDPAMQSCRKKKSEAADASFLADVRVHIDEFIHASTQEHKTCFQRTIQKMFGMSKVAAERSSSSSTESDAKEVESVLPLQATTST